MGCCASSQFSKPTITSLSHHTHHKPLSIATDKVTIIHTTQNKVFEHKQPTQAKDILAQFPNSFLCSAEAMSIGSCMPQVPNEEELQPAQIYFLMPFSKSNSKPLSLPDLCNLAVKASSVMGINGADAEISTGKSRRALR